MRAPPAAERGRSTDTLCGSAFWRRLTQRPAHETLGTEARHGRADTCRRSLSPRSSKTRDRGPGSRGHLPPCRTRLPRLGRGRLATRQQGRWATFRLEARSLYVVLGHCGIRHVTALALGTPSVAPGCASSERWKPSCPEHRPFHGSVRAHASFCSAHSITLASLRCREDLARRSRVSLPKLAVEQRAGADSANVCTVSSRCGSARSFDRRVDHEVRCPFREPDFGGF